METLKIQSPSPNFNSRNGYVPELIVVHCTDGYFPSDMQYLQNPDPGSVVGPVSAHFVIAPNGDIHQLVDTANAAWHAGRVLRPTATLKPGVNPNYYSIGIEVSMVSTDQATAKQGVSLRALIVELGTKYHIPLDRKHVIGHREIYAEKTCPGTIDVATLLPKPPVAPPVFVPTVPYETAVANLKKSLWGQVLDMAINIIKKVYGRR